MTFKTTDPMDSIEMRPIIEPIERKLLESELTPDKFLRSTNKGGNEIYVATAQDSPRIMDEIGRLRELSFRSAGGGTGVEVDIDELDLVEGGYKQLFVWDPQAREIIGGYRFIICSNPHQKYLSTEHYFRFSNRFRNEYLPYTIELGRSFVQPKYQGTRESSKAIYSLDNLWDGLGALVVKNPESRYFFGKVTMYGKYNKAARDILIFFLRKYFPDKDNLVIPIHPITLDIDYNAMEALFNGGSYDADYKILSLEIRKLGENIPPLINSYMNISPSMKVFGTVVNPDFGDVEETGILITIDDIYLSKSERYYKLDDWNEYNSKKG